MNADITAGASKPSRAADCTSNKGAGECLKPLLQVWPLPCTTVTTTLAAESTAFKDSRRDENRLVIQIETEEGYHERPRGRAGRTVSGRRNVRHAQRDRREHHE